MVDLLIRKAMPQTVEEVPPGCKPLSAAEGDFVCRRQLPCGCWSETQRRLRMVNLADYENNRVHKVIRDLGPPSGEDTIYVPCDELVEMAQVWEAFEQAARNREKRAAVRRLYLPDRQRHLRNAVQDLAEELVLRKEGAVSSFGPYQMTERRG